MIACSMLTHLKKPDSNFPETLKFQSTSKKKTSVTRTRLKVVGLVDRENGLP